jgi:phage terminase small subunit
VRKDATCYDQTVKRLPRRQQLFVAEYLVDLNATRAAIAAGYSERTAYSQGQRLLNNVEVAKILADKTSKRLDKLEITADSVLQGIAQLAHFDVRRFFDEKGNPKQIHELSDAEANAVAGFEVIELFDGEGDEKHCFGYLKKFRIADRGQNLERLGRYLKLFVDRQEHSGADGGPVRFVVERIGEQKE